MLPSPILCKITSNATGAGYYNARRQIRKRTPVFDPTTSLTMATYYQDINSHDDVFVVNFPEAGGGHSLTVNTYVWCEVAGPSTATTPRMVLSVISGGSGAPDDTLFMVHLDQTGGSDGSETTAPTYTYTVSKWVSSTTGGSTLATGASPLAPRINGSFSTAINGYAFYHSGTLVLAEALEAPATDKCPTAP